MKIYFTFLIFILILSGCSNNDTPNKANVLSPNAANTTQINANSLTATDQNQSTMQPYNGIENVDQNAFNTKSSNEKQVNKPINTNQNQMSRIAPDESKVSITMDKNGVPIETREFLNHQTLVKVEKISIGKGVKYKVYLKNGKVVEAPADKMENFTALAPNNILAAIGLKPPPTRPEEMVPEMKKQQQ